MPSWFKPQAFEQLTLMFVIPVGLLLFSWLLQRHAKGKMNAAVDLFMFVTACDFAYLARTERVANRINPIFAPVYSPLFTVMLIMSLVMLAWAARVQNAIHQYVSGDVKFFPWTKVVLCWFSAMVLIAFHLVVTVGGW